MQAGSSINDLVYKASGFLIETANDEIAMVFESRFSFAMHRLSGETSMRRQSLLIIVLLTAFNAPARASSADDLAACKALSEQATALIRAGQTVLSTRSQFRRCIRLQRAEQRRLNRTPKSSPNQ